MAATFEWDEANGAVETVTHNVTNANWKNVDDTITLVSDGTNWFEVARTPN